MKQKTAPGLKYFDCAAQALSEVYVLGVSNGLEENFYSMISTTYFSLAIIVRVYELHWSP